MLEEYLLEVRKPAQYIGGEWNAPRKDFDQARIKFGLCFPDLYEVGMSNLGLRIIYGVLNNIPDVICERFFSPAEDFEQILRDRNLQVLSLESHRKLSDFDLAGFSLGSELDYTNVLNILELCGIPLSASSRDQRYPLIIGGGPCVLNPEPMHEFFDLFFIGEAEEAVIELVDIYRSQKVQYKAGKISKEDLLFLLSRVEGVYVPSLYEVSYAQDGRIEAFKPKLEGLAEKIKKRLVKNLNVSFYPKDWLVPYIQIIHDRIILEIMRGCPNRCRFCQARSQYFPLRQKGVEEILNLSRQLYSNSGYEEIALSGLSVSDYSDIEKLLKGLTDFFKPKAISLSLPSLKAKSVVGPLSSIIAQTKKTGLTFAPEAGSERLRNILAKDFNSEEFFQSLREAYSSGYQHVKLYFMIGLPKEEKEDLDAIVAFALRVSQLRKDLGKPAAGVNISINTLIPKPHTPLQWLGMADLEEIREKQDYLREKIKRHKRLNLNFHNRSMSFLEGILSRGDRRLSKVILAAFKSQAKFDAWSPSFDFQKWLKAFSDSGIDPNDYSREKKQDEILAWDFLEVGITKETLLCEFNKTIAIE